MRECAVCKKQLNKNQLRCCSIACVSKLGGKAFHEKYDAHGAGNPNWKDGRSKTPILYTKRFKELNPEKNKAHEAVRRAIRAGKLKRQHCEICQIPNAQAHHLDYSRPLTITWLCPKHHAAQHIRA